MLKELNSMHEIHCNKRLNFVIATNLLYYTYYSIIQYTNFSDCNKPLKFVYCIGKKIDYSSCRNFFYKIIKPVISVQFSFNYFLQ